ncbi:MAG TPA: hypothetical protein VGK04_12005 [Thermoanaerobaculia bacterium]|jgi:hypothetical protein
MATTLELLSAVERLEKQSRRWLPFSAIALAVIIAAVVYSIVTLAGTQRELASAEKSLHSKAAEIKAAETKLNEVTRKLAAAESQLNSAVRVGSNALAHATSGAAVMTQPGAARWVYLGSYRADLKRWDTKYLDFPDSAEPLSFVDRQLRVREETGTLNVRSGLPNDAGVLPPAVHVLRPGQVVTVIEVKRWANSPFLFARVRY